MNAATSLMLVLACLSRVQSDEPPDLILHHGKVFTSDPGRPWAEAVAIRGARIVAVGNSGEVLARGGSCTRRIDLGGRVVIPGINDAHQHQSPDVLDHARGDNYLEFKGRPPGPEGWDTVTWAEVRQAVAEATTKTPEGALLIGIVGAGAVDDPAANRVDLDKVAPRHRVMLITWAGHDFTLNTAAMRAFGIGEDAQDVPGGFIDRVPGKPTCTGRFYEYARYRLARQLEEHVPEAQAVEGLRRFAAEGVRFGVTSIQNMSFLPTAGYIGRLRKAAVPIRVRVIHTPIASAPGAVRAEDFRRSDSLPPRVIVSGTKWILDGTPIERGAFLRQPYADRPGWFGRPDFTEMEVRTLLRQGLAAESPLLFHVVGDATAEMLLSALEATDAAAQWARRRVRIEHGDGLTSDLIPRAARLGVVVVQNPTHFALPDLARKRLGAERAARFLPMRSLLRARIPLALGSDGPLNPYLNILLATTHPTNPAEALTREEAVAAYTRGAAFAEFTEREKGTLAPGMLADLAVLSQDIFSVPADRLPGTESVLTLIGGVVVHDSNALGPK
jgi:predicted amidohydrolase YtcJ